tara:strand:+ start:4008 stop:4121 length:114 start_codon:yes stop_codon:yes gene_type:complete
MTIEERVEKLYKIVSELHQAVNILFQIVQGDNNESEE